ncbi:MAG: hypothetical protein GEV04_11210 [Actinophytocola sp.]|nr:hypothetical protein [Actinophytocola sp.]
MIAERVGSTTKVTGDLMAPEAQEGSEVAAYIEASRITATDDPDIGPVSASVRQLCVDRHTGRAFAPCDTQFVQEASYEEPETPEQGRVYGDDRQV